jgi:hypothetical protein
MLSFLRRQKAEKAMIRLGKPVQLLEWGLGTSTVNQVWHIIGQGKLRNGPKWYAGNTTIVVELDGQIDRQNENNSDIKLAQEGEGMASGTSKWGEVAMGKLTEIKGGKKVVYVLVPGAQKIEK